MFNISIFLEVIKGILIYTLYIFLKSERELMSPLKKDKFMNK